MIYTDLADKFVGSLIGGAAGDALGYPVEFMDESRIFEKYGDEGITDYELDSGYALISDDTQMTLFTAEGLLSARGKARKLLPCIWNSYLDWLKTQRSDEPASFMGLLTEERLYYRRAPGNTCLSALKRGRAGRLDRPINDSKGCGGVMRVAPIALYCFSARIDILDADRLGAEAAALTHGHELGYIPAAHLVHIIYRILGGYGLREAVIDAIGSVGELFGTLQHYEYASELLRRALALAESDADRSECIRSLGEGWVAEEALAIAVYAAVKYSSDIHAALVAAVNHSGDSDSTGAITGNILGALLGMSAIPKRLTRRLELSSTVRELALELYSVPPSAR